MDTQTEETLTFIGNLVTLILTIFLLSFFVMMLWNGRKETVDKHFKVL